MTRIYLIRHVEAEGNLYRRAQGQYNSNVTALGKRQLAALAERFRGVALDALWSSDLNRTRTTAGAILKYHPELTLNLSERLREIDVGVWEDMPWGNIAADYPEQMELFTHDPARWSVPGGEPYAVLQKRVREEVLSLAERYEGGTIAVVSHGLAIRSLLCDIFGIPSAEIDSLPYGDNSSVSLLTAEDGRLSVSWYNDSTHLEEAGLSTFSRQRWRQQQKEKIPAGRIFTRFAPLDPRAERDLYTRCYAATWQESHGSLKSFSPLIYLHTAEKRARQDPRCLQTFWKADAFTGIVELDPERGAEDGAGWISLLYLEPEARGLRLGVQLIGYAVSYFRRAGRRSLRLHVAQDNENAYGFYTHVGFRPIREAEGVGGRLWLMEMDIRQQVLPPEEIPEL